MMMARTPPPAIGAPRCAVPGGRPAARRPGQEVSERPLRLRPRRAPDWKIGSPLPGPHGPGRLLLSASIEAVGRRAGSVWRRDGSHPSRLAHELVRRTGSQQADGCTQRRVEVEGGGTNRRRNRSKRNRCTVHRTPKGAEAPGAGWRRASNPTPVISGHSTSGSSILWRDTEVVTVSLLFAPPKTRRFGANSAKDLLWAGA